jgi:hypothetical protein
MDESRWLELVAKLDARARRDSDGYSPLIKLIHVIVRRRRSDVVRRFESTAGDPVFSRS